jgi:chromosome segregation ATPase
MSQMQKQLNEQIAQLKNGKKPGQQMSKELSQIAQKQAALRRALGELEKSLQKGKEKSGGLADVKQMMEKTERELLNKKFTPETIMRQQQILSRLLESEKALMERELDQKREAEKPDSKERTTLPAEIRDLLQKNRSQKEQLQQGTPKLSEMYQDVFDKYFESIQNSGL